MQPNVSLDTKCDASNISVAADSPLASVMTTLAANFDQIPQVMRDCPHWVLFRIEERVGKTTKVPYQPNGRKASTKDPKTWSDFETVKKAYEMHVGEGIGFVFSRDTFSGVDLDNCRNEYLIFDWAKKIIRELDSYAEVSPSGDGVHVIVKGSIPEGCTGRKETLKCPADTPEMVGQYQYAAVEIYSEGRFFTVTGNHLQGSPMTVEERETELRALYRRMNGKSTTHTNATSKDNEEAQHAGSGLSDEDVAKRIMDSINAQKIDALFKGEWKSSGIYNSQSDADQGLCNHLAYFADKDPVVMDRLFRQSGLMRPKWDEMRGSQTYGQLTIDKAIADTKEVYRDAIGRKTAEGKSTRPIDADLTIEDLTIVTKVDQKTGEEDRKFSPSLASDSIQLKIPFGSASWEVESYEKEPDIWTCSENGVWTRDGDNLITELCDGIADDLSTHRNLAETKRRIRSALRKNPIEFDTCNPHLVGTANGWACDLITGQVRRVKPEDHISIDLILPVEYDPQATCSQIFRFYDSICSDNCSKMAMIDDDVATLDLVQWQYIQLRLGLGGNGKGQRQKFRRRFFGRYSIASIPLKDLNNDGFAISELFRKRAVDCGETTRDAGRGEKYSTALLKRLTGDDDLAAPRKYKNRLPFVPFCKVTIDANSAPKFDDDSRGFTRRFRRINLPYFFTDLVDQRDPTQKSIDPLIHKRITSSHELSGYLNVLLERAKEIVKDRRYPSCDHLTKGYQEQVYSIDEFVDKFCEVDSRKCIQDGWYVKVADLFKAFEQWASLANASPSNPQAFGRAVGNLTGIKSCSRRLPNEEKPVKAYVGIQFDVDRYCEEIAKLKNRLIVTDMLPNCNDINSNELPCDQCNQLSKRYLELKEKFGQGNPVQISKEDSSEKIGYIGNIGNTKAGNTDSEKGIGHKKGNISVTAGEEEACKPAPVDLKDGLLGNVGLDHSESVLAYIQNGTGMLNNNDAELNELQPSADFETTAMTNKKTAKTTENLANGKDETRDVLPSPQDDGPISNERDIETVEISPWTRRFIDQKLAKYGRFDPARGRRGIPAEMLKGDELKLIKNDGWTFEKDDEGTDVWWTPGETQNEVGTVMGS